MASNFCFNEPDDKLIHVNHAQIWNNDNSRHKQWYVQGCHTLNCLLGNMLSNFLRYIEFVFYAFIMNKSTRSYTSIASYILK